MRPRNLAKPLAAGLFAAAVVCGAGPATPQDAGRALFEENCAVCHGLGGQGDGPMAATLSLPVADLTGLSARADGAFPLIRVVRRIDGRDPVLAHGGPMPLFGALADGPAAVADAPDGTPVQSTRAVLDIVAYLRTLQR